MKWETIANLGWWWLLPILLIYALGVYLGNKGSIVVYRNFNDLMIVGLLVIIPVGLISLLAFISGDNSANQESSSQLFLVGLVLVGLVMLLILYRTFRDNPNPLKMLLALYVKLPTGILFFFHLSNIFMGKSRTKRRESIFWTIIMVPLLYGLVHDKSKGKLPGISGRSHY
ncbi:hypothetical protein DEU29_1443 [Idiomarina aquatica]|uniref:Uncharacterized protein n=1 Tax=Idiomarina aquatica TaxID=1327752 RepID=A0A4R6NVU5_9GAMM|nr:hypothetical protein [Idiomarina aquatica]TDP26789.1 hypothetical protein DEU29_1443 [Idiomarina aquatica]